MKAIEFNGKTVKTNYEPWGEYPRSNGNVGKKQVLVCAESDTETWESLLGRCVERGYRQVRLVRITTAVRGYTKSAAICTR